MRVTHTMNGPAGHTGLHSAESAPSYTLRGPKEDGEEFEK